MPLLLPSKVLGKSKGIALGNAGIAKQGKKHWANIHQIMYLPRCIHFDVRCETLSDIFGVAMQPYCAIFRESGD